jgi:hypothetical protein
MDCLVLLKEASAPERERESYHTAVMVAREGGAPVAGAASSSFFFFSLTV